MGLTNGWWVWTGSPIGASTTNDTGLAKKELELIKNQIEIRDLLIVDRAFRCLRDQLCCVAGRKQKLVHCLFGKHRKPMKFLNKEVGFCTLIDRFFGKIYRGYY